MVRLFRENNTGMHAGALDGGSAGSLSCLPSPVVGRCPGRTILLRGGQGGCRDDVLFFCWGLRVCTPTFWRWKRGRVYGSEGAVQGFLVRWGIICIFCHFLFFLSFLRGERMMALDGFGDKLLYSSSLYLRFFEETLFSPARLFFYLLLFFLLSCKIFRGVH